MKHRALSILLALVFLLSACMFCTTAFAASGNQDGVTAELTTDKTDYVAGEPISVSLVVKNANARVTNVRTELILPAGVSLTTGTLVTTGVDLAPNTEANYNYGLTVDEPAPTTTTPPTTTPSTTTPPTTNVPTTPGEGNDDVAPETSGIAMAIYGVLATASLVGLIALVGVKNIFKQRWFVLVLCAAMLLGVVGPIAAFAAATEQTFTVTEKITLNGVSAEIKAIISYDMDDEAAYTEEVAFKKDGQFLWSKVVEMGYYLPSSVTWEGQKTTKNGDYRPEVTASYIDMLFGCTSNQTGQVVSGEFKVDIFPEDAEQTALIGRTADPASTAALELIDEDEWIITVIDGKLVVTGWYDNATAAAARALYALATADAADITLKLPMIGKMDYVDVDMPFVPFGNFLGGMDSDFGAVVLHWNEIKADDFDRYCALLEAVGYELYESNTMDGFKKTKTLEFATYVKGNDAILVQYLPVSMLDQDVNALTDLEKSIYNYTFSPNGDNFRLILTTVDRLGNNDAANTGWTDLGIAPKMHMVNLYDKYGDNNIGQAQIFVLADGSFIVVDGGVQGDMEQLYRTLKYKNERPDGKIVVAAWFLTHDHADHDGALAELAKSEYAKEITIEQIVLNHHAFTYLWRSQNAPYRYADSYAHIYDNIEEIVGSFVQGDNFKRVIPHMGQILKIRNAEVEMLTVGEEDLYPVHIDNSNGLSMVFRVTFPGTTEQSVLITGDSAHDQTTAVFFPLMIDELYGDILQVSHHGLGGQAEHFYQMCKDEDVVFVPTANPDWLKPDYYLSQTFTAPLFNGEIGTAKLLLAADEYVQTLELPFDSENDHVLRTKIGTYTTKYQAKEMDISLLPTFRFQGTWGTSKDTLVAYLKNYTADVLVLPLIDQNTTTKYNKADLVNELYEALDYNYIYYAPVWGCEADANMETGDGTMGHVILSTYPILKAETGILVEGTPDAAPEGRGYAHILMDVEGVEMDLVATHFNDAGNWTKFAELYEQWGDYTVIAGNTKIGGNAASAPIALTASAFDSDVTILGSKGIEFTNAATNHDLANIDSEFFVNANLDPIYTATLTIPASFEFDPNGTPVRQAFISWWCHSWGGGDSAFDMVVNNLREQNAAVVALQNVCNSTVGIEDPATFMELLGYEYGYFAVQNPATQGGSFLLSHYPIEPQADLIVSDGSDDRYSEARTFGHVIVNIDGTEVDVWFGTTDSSNGQVARVTDAIKSVADETGRPFIFSANDIGSLKGQEYFAGYQCYNYYTDYVANVMVTTGPITITNAEAVYSGIAWAGVDNINILDFELTDGALTKEPEGLPEVPDANPDGVDVALVPAFYFSAEYSKNAASIHNALVDLGADVLAITRIDRNTTSNNNMDVPSTIAEALKSVYPYSYTMQVNAVDGGYECHLILSKYEILETENIPLGNETGDYIGVGYARAMLDVDGLNVDVFFGWMNHQNFWAELAPHVKASEADAWVVVGDMCYARPEKGGIESALGQTISAAFEHYYYEGYGYHMCNIISSNNGTFSNAKLEPCTDRFGFRADPLYQADITFQFA